MRTVKITARKATKSSESAVVSIGGMRPA
jgi:hypothetical protein